VSHLSGDIFVAFLEKEGQKETKIVSLQVRHGERMPCVEDPNDRSKVDDELR
jgi:hypothetical protein